MKAQTTLDFLIGITVFLAVMVFIFGFVPGILEPFDIAGEEEPALSDRIADSVAQDQLGNASEPYVLDRYCTVAFFNDSRSEAPAECNYHGETIHDRFNLSSTQRINVTIEGNTTGGSSSTLLCWTDESTATDEPGIDEVAHCDGDDTLLEIGDERPDGGETTITARRIVSLHGESVTLKVVVW